MQIVIDNHVLSIFIVDIKCYLSHCFLLVFFHHTLGQLADRRIICDKFRLGFFSLKFSIKSNIKLKKRVNFFISSLQTETFNLAIDICRYMVYYAKQEGQLQCLRH